MCWRSAAKLTVSSCAVLVTVGVTLAAQQEGRHDVGVPGVMALPTGCPTPTGVARAVSPGDVSITTPDGSPGGPSASGPNQRTVFYNGGAVVSPRNTGTRSARSSTQSGSTGSTTVRTHASGDIAGTTPPGKATAKKTRPIYGRPRVWTVQVASYETFDAALAMQANLCNRGYEARIRGNVRPFQVRVGRYASSDSAMRVARRLTTRDLTVFITPAE